LIAALVLALVLRSSKPDWAALRSAGALLVLTGVLLGAHWWCFFEAVRRGSVGLGLLTFASYPAFVCALSGPFLKEWPDGRMWTGCGAVVGGLVLLVPDSAFAAGRPGAIAFGLASGLSFAGLTLLNRRLTARFAPMVLVLVQTALAGLCLAPFVGRGMLHLSQDWLALVILGVFCTALAHVCFTASLLRLEAGTVAITTALEPVYGMALAGLFLGERPTPFLLLGGALIIGGSLLASLGQNRGE
jgi:drug/metabolite transporter (DMT)-like permease